jgi:LDH2 family malate/lactate/ureidoglycolate dehydrogenase
MGKNVITFTVHKLQKLAGGALHAIGFSHEEAGIIVSVMVRENLAGYDSYGGR